MEGSDWLLAEEGVSYMMTGSDRFLTEEGVSYVMTGSDWFLTEEGVTYLLYWVKDAAAVCFVNVTVIGQRAQGVLEGLGFELWEAGLDHVFPERRSNLGSELC